MYMYMTFARGRVVKALPRGARSICRGIPTHRHCQGWVPVSAYDNALAIDQMTACSTLLGRAVNGTAGICAVQTGKLANDGFNHPRICPNTLL
ncbi:hypothetical protein BS17DRAFT_770947 [Gyrodon lividus]|nr:hypothetical protein BS17DRAFT_770947 [Gyrodon lividus]